MQLSSLSLVKAWWCWHVDWSWMMTGPIYFHYFFAGKIFSCNSISTCCHMYLMLNESSLVLLLVRFVSYGEEWMATQTMDTFLDHASWWQMQNHIQSPHPSPQCLLLAWQCGLWFSEVVKSFHDLYEGVEIHGSKSKLKAVVTECRGDWKYQVDPGSKFSMFLWVYSPYILQVPPESF